MPRSFLAPAALALLTPFASNAPAAEAPRVAELRTQRVGETTYFTVLFRAPADLKLPVRNWQNLDGLIEGQRVRLARLPRLVPQDDRTSAVYTTLELPRSDGHDTDLTFAGKVHTAGRARLLLLYPTRKVPPASASRSLAPALALALNIGIVFAPAGYIPTGGQQPPPWRAVPNRPHVPPPAGG